MNINNVIARHLSNDLWKCTDVVFLAGVRIFDADEGAKRYGGKIQKFENSQTKFTERPRLCVRRTGRHTRRNLAAGPTIFY